MLACGYDFCIYNRAGVCRLGTVALDARGCCTDAIDVALDPAVLQPAKDSMLAAYSSADGTDSRSDDQHCSTV